MVKALKSFALKHKKAGLTLLVIGVVCVTAGVTYALFSDRASSQANVISSGNADLKIMIPATGCGDWSDTCPGKQWSNVYPDFADSYEVFLKNASASPISLSVVPFVEETGSSQALYDNTYMEITWDNGSQSTGRFNLQAWKNNSAIQLKKLAQNEVAGPYLVKFDIPKELGNEIANSNIEFNLVFASTQLEFKLLTMVANPTIGGTVAGTGRYFDGSLANITATAGAGYAFLHWEGTGITDVNAASTTVLMDGDKSVTAVFGLSDLLAEWKFNENSGTSVADTSGHGNNGTISGATWVAGRNGSGLEFDGANDYVSIPYNSNFNLGATTSFTIEYWFNRHTTGWNAAFSQLSTSEQFGMKGHYASRFWSGSTEHMWTIAKTVSDPNDPMDMSEAMQRLNYPSLNVWHHVANVYNGTTMKTYIDGVLTGNTSVSGVILAPIANFPSLIGAQQDGNYQGQYFDGLLDTMRIWKKALSLSEIQNHYNNP
jgi:predicted ribosomally synthesized peptide with SipW-like signal peptide